MRSTGRSLPQSKPLGRLQHRRWGMVARMQKRSPLFRHHCLMPNLKVHRLRHSIFPFPAGLCGPIGRMGSEWSPKVAVVGGFSNVESSRFECGVLCGVPAKSQVRSGGPEATRTSGPFISNKWAS